MESHVLIPEELTLRSASSPDCSSPSVARFLEQGVSVIAARDIPKGTRFTPDQGTLRIGRLDVYSTLQQNDVRRTFFYLISSEAQFDERSRFHSRASQISAALNAIKRGEKMSQR